MVAPSGGGYGGVEEINARPCKVLDYKALIHHAHQIAA